MRIKSIGTVRFITVLIIAMSLLLVHSSARLIVGASAAQDPNATLPPPKPKPAPKKSAPPARTTRRSPTRTNGGNSGTSNAAADEIAFWNSIKDSRDPEDFRAYLVQYPNGKFAALAKNRLKILEVAPPKPAATPDAAKETGAAEITFWNSIKESTNPDDYREYLKKYPNGQFAEIARNRTNYLEEEKRKASAPRAGAIVRNQMGMEMAYIPAGTFMMGSPASEAQRSSDEGPQHQVTIREGFYMGRYEVTQAQWQEVMGTNPSYFKDCGGNCPVENVSWNDAQEFIRRLNARGDGYSYRLPSEAEWEYACRAGTTTAFAFGDSLSSDQANFDGNYPYGGAAKGVYRQKTTPVGSFQPNAWGLYDMHGNVWEWVEDWYHESYNGAPSDGSAWESGGEQKYRVLRGGSWFINGFILRSAFRNWYSPVSRLYYIGFRVVAFARSS
jgi:formylglycine-generating enzyme required for sulfatase activity